MSLRRFFFGLAAAALSSSGAFAGAPGCPSGGCYQHVSTPPVYGTVPETVMVSPPTSVARELPPQYAMVAEKVLVSPGGKRWEVTRDAYGNMIGCWVYDPPRYAVEHRRVMVRAPHVVHERVPAVYATRERTVMVSPGSSRWVPIAKH